MMFFNKPLTKKCKEKSRLGGLARKAQRLKEKRINNAYQALQKTSP